MNTKYNGGYRKEAIRLSDEIGVKAAGENLGIAVKTLYNWRRSARIKAGKPLKGINLCLDRNLL